MKIPSCFVSIPADKYHADARAGKYLSSHLLADFRRSPILYRKKTTGEIAPSDSPALALGRAAHTLILEGRAAFDEEYLVSDGPKNPKTGEPYGRTTKAFAEWSAAQTKAVVPEREFGLMLKLQKAVWLNHAASELLSEGFAEGVVRRVHRDVPCQIRCDWVCPGGLVDLKTCDCLDYFEGSARALGYISQMAFYRAILREAGCGTLPVHLIAVEKSEPLRCGVWRIADAALDEAESRNDAAIDRLLECRRTDAWPTGFEDVRILTDF